jgi:hypothetical protein
MLSHLIRTALPALLIAAPLSAHAAPSASLPTLPILTLAESNDALQEGQALTTRLGPNASAIIYWVSEPDGCHVVVTVDTIFGKDADAEQHAVVRFAAVLPPGQSQLISVPLAIGERQQVLRVSRIGSGIEVRWVTSPSM